MSSSTDDLKGRLKQAAGDLTDDDDLRREGEADRAGAKVKQAAEKVKDAVSDGVDKAKDELHRDR